MGYKISFADNVQISAEDINGALTEIAGDDYSDVHFTDGTEYGVAELNAIRKDMICAGLIGYPDITVTSGSDARTITIKNALIITPYGVRVEIDGEGVNAIWTPSKNGFYTLPIYIYLYCVGSNYATGITVTTVKKDNDDDFTLIATYDGSAVSYGAQAELKLKNPQFMPIEQTIEVDDAASMEALTVTPDNIHWKRLSLPDGANGPIIWDRENGVVFSSDGVSTIGIKGKTGSAFDGWQYTKGRYYFEMYLKTEENGDVTIAVSSGISGRLIFMGGEAYGQTSENLVANLDALNTKAAEIIAQQNNFINGGAENDD